MVAAHCAMPVSGRQRSGPKAGPVDRLTYGYRSIKSPLAKTKVSVAATRSSVALRDSLKDEGSNCQDCRRPIGSGLKKASLMSASGQHDAVAYDMLVKVMLMGTDVCLTAVGQSAHALQPELDGARSAEDAS